MTTQKLKFTKFLAVKALLTVAITGAACADSSPAQEYRNFRDVFETSAELMLNGEVVRYIANVSLGNYDPSARDYCEPIVSAEIIGEQPIRVSLTLNLTEDSMFNDAVPAAITFLPKRDGSFLSQIAFTGDQILYSYTEPQDLSDIWIRPSNDFPTLYTIFSDAIPSELTASIQAYKSACRAYRS